MKEHPRTLRKLSNLFRRDLAEPFLGGLYARVEALRELAGALANIEVGKAALDLLPAFHPILSLLSYSL